MATSANQQQAGIYLPAKKTIGNAAIKPVNKPQSESQQVMRNTSMTLPEQKLDPVTGRPIDRVSSQPAPSSSPTNNGAGLLGNINVTQPVKPDAPAAPNIAQPEFTANKYQSNGFTGVKGGTEFNRDPRSESLVQNQLTGLLDPESALMKRAVSQSQAQAASRGLQSSSLAAGAGTGAMIDRALPIAQQDAQTFGNAQQLGWQQSFQADQNNLAREQDARMLDKQGALQTNLQNNQFSFESTQQNANRQQQASLQELQYLQSLGMLDYQGQQQLQQMERSAQLNQQRDLLLQRFNDMNMDKSFLQQMQLTQAQYQQQDAMFEKQVSAQAAMDYRNAVSSGYNYYLEQVAAVYGNPNMTPEQQTAGVAKLGQLFEQQRLQLQAIFGFASPTQPAQPTLPGTDTWNGIPPGASNPLLPQPPTGSGGGGGLLDRVFEQANQRIP